jgi:hypothetical protein
VRDQVSYLYRKGKIILILTVLLSVVNAILFVTALSKLLSFAVGFIIHFHVIILSCIWMMRNGNSLVSSMSASGPN